MYSLGLRNFVFINLALVLQIYVQAIYNGVHACYAHVPCHAVGDALYYGLVRMLTQVVNDLYCVSSYIKVVLYY